MLADGKQELYNGVLSHALSIGIIVWVIVLTCLSVAGSFEYWLVGD